MPAPPMGAPPRLAPPPPPRRPLTGAQRGKLVGLFALLAVLGLLFGYIVSLMVPTSYAARTTVQYNIAGENTSDFLKTDRNLTTQLVLMTSRNVLQPVADTNGIDVDSLTKKVSATILNGSDIIQLEVRDSNRDSGVTLANAIAKQYLTVANNSGPKGYLQDQLAAVKKQQAGSSPTFPAQPGATATAGNSAADTAALAARTAALQGQLDAMNLTQNQSSILVPAYSVEDPVSPNGGVAALTGMVCGLVIALMTAVTLSRRWSRN
ncbi:MAG TPA: hypothetical protein VGH99_24540 [Pseudonocardia sp.]|jgi:capsular polysaccharide biosynthesis protein